jgi:Na+-transporting methylmalonyl-CoA/oxaloacetate decarboxylase gamma subunit
MPFIITSDTSNQYLREEDAVKGFEIAVGNGQSRMALTILVDVINGIMDIFNSFEDESIEEEETPAPVAVEEPKLQKQTVVNETPEEETLPVAKPVAKKETKTTEEK